MQTKILSYLYNSLLNVCIALLVTSSMLTELASPHAYSDRSLLD